MYYIEYHYFLEGWLLKDLNHEIVDSSSDINELVNSYNNILYILQ